MTFLSWEQLYALSVVFLYPQYLPDECKSTQNNYKSYNYKKKENVNSMNKLIYQYNILFYYYFA